MLRELGQDELKFVAGGDIVVTAPTSGLSDMDRLLLSYAMEQQAISYSDGSSFGGGGGGYSVTVPIGEPTPYTPGSTDDLVDTDGDGVPDSPEIVVTSTMSPEAIAALGNLANWYLFADLTAAGFVLGEAYGGQAGLAFVAGTGNPVSSEALRDQLWDGLIEQYRYLPAGSTGYIPGAAIP